MISIRKIYIYHAQLYSIGVINNKRIIFISILLHSICLFNKKQLGTSLIEFQLK